jgi:trimethylamine-N-oxide reductase (cytochrome c)
MRLSQNILAERNRLYSEDRILYPMKRVDWDPNGERNIKNRGKSSFERISWDEAATIIANEIKRNITIGPDGKIDGHKLRYYGSHHNWGKSAQDCSHRALFSACSTIPPPYWTPDSGRLDVGLHMWGFYWASRPHEQFDLLQDPFKNTDMDSCSGRTTPTPPTASTPVRRATSGVYG